MAQPDGAGDDLGACRPGPCTATWCLHLANSKAECCAMCAEWPEAAERLDYAYKMLTAPTGPPEPSTLAAVASHVLAALQHMNIRHCALSHPAGTVRP